MRFLLDQCSDARLIPYLQSLGHDVTRIATHYPPGLSDEAVLSIAVTEQRILITDDRDFGELVFRRHLSHTGVLYLRLGVYAPLATLIERIDYVLAHYSDQLDHFLVITRHTVRVRKI